jgi:hypothetical protein
VGWVKKDSQRSSGAHGSVTRMVRSESTQPYTFFQYLKCGLFTVLVYCVPVSQQCSYSNSMTIKARPLSILCRTTRTHKLICVANSSSGREVSLWHTHLE